MPASPDLRAARRRLLGGAVGLAAVVVMAVTLVAGVGPASANLQPEIVLRLGADVTRSYPGIPRVGDGVQSRRSPSDCDGPADRCDLIPFKIVVPQLRANEEFFVRLSLTWDPAPVSGQTTNDMNLFVWTDPPGEQHVSGASGTRTPERMTLVSPRKGAYLIHVDNFMGVNRGYTVRAAMATEQFSQPTEVLAPTRPAPRTQPGGPAPSASAPARPSPGADPSVAPAPAPDGSLPSSALLPTAAPFAPDDDLAALRRRRSVFTEELATSAVEVRPAAAGRLSSKPAPVQASHLIVWAVVVPLAALAVAVVIVRRRDPTSLDSI